MSIQSLYHFTGFCSAESLSEWGSWTFIKHWTVANHRINNQSLFLQCYHYSTKSSDHLSLVIPNTRSVLCKQAFSVARPRLRNSLPLSFWSAWSLVTFCSLPKAYLSEIANSPWAVSLLADWSSTCLPEHGFGVPSVKALCITNQYSRSC